MGFPKRSKRKNSWNSLSPLASISPLPWLCIGDFNYLLYVSDKRGGAEHPMSLLDGFRDTIDRSTLIDIPLCGHQFTWERSRGSDRWIQERLGRAMATKDWMSLWPRHKLFSLVSTVSDHSSVLLVLDYGSCSYGEKRFRFENAWLANSNIHLVVEESWSASPSFDLLSHIERCGKALHEWGRRLNGNQLSRIQNSMDEDSIAQFVTLQNDLNSLIS
ncbi:hypothetical protein P3X46_026905 [Hevea brasiliensis]|uniref:Endonuclease/exonuclease/phosphatase domain-containing protein n=1 Tax=Hevea brasiliensis TaxID=3981 RepID=A0ABQ9KY65_HEVBR|nr:uncharacterized protein LOC110654208 [Hevea brasiliensis]KAJ9153470.1 hypothetical protein P3X46_026905 [Hevea brasiliensis]